MIRTYYYKTIMASTANKLRYLLFGFEVPDRRTSRVNALFASDFARPYRLRASPRRSPTGQERPAPGFSTNFNRRVTFILYFFREMPEMRCRFGRQYTAWLYAYPTYTFEISQRKITGN